MLSNLMGSAGTAGTVTGLAYLGCITALAATGHISGSDALVAFGILGGGATATVATHVAGNAITNAAASPAVAAPTAPETAKPVVTV